MGNDITVKNGDFTDNTVVKYYRRIMNSFNPHQTIEYLKSLISNPKAPQRNKIQKALDLALNDLNQAQSAPKAN